MERSNSHEFSPLDHLSCFGLMSTLVFKILRSQEVSFEQTNVGLLNKERGPTAHSILLFP